jgi:superfamily I DNA/RNA helicase
MESSSSLILEACAGSGKTTSMVDGINAMDPNVSVIACAFNKRIAVELGERMPPHVVSKTLNALGHGAWAQMLGKKRITLEADKNYTIAKNMDVLKDFGQGPKLVALAKAYGIVPKGAKGAAKGLVEDEDENWLDIMDAHDIDYNDSGPRMIRTCREMLLESIKWAWEGVIDFDDQLYMSTLWNAPLLRAEVVMVDEAQDISHIQRKMLHRMAINRVVAVGDRHQAIYAFRGADHTSLDAIADETQADMLPLTVSFRCPRAIVREAQQYVPHIEPSDFASEGTVVQEDLNFQAFIPGDAIICRNNKPLVKMAFLLLGEGIRCKVLGRDIGKSIKNLVKKMDCHRLNDLAEALQKYELRMVNKFIAAGKEARAAALNDKIESIFIMMEHTEGDTVDDFYEVLDDLFSDRVAPITLCTIHKSKGLEWDNVYFLDSDLIPSKYAKSEAQLQQEHNLAYVAITRAKQKLSYIFSPE